MKKRAGHSYQSRSSTEGEQEAEEGCLSVPGFRPVRGSRIEVAAVNGW